MPAPFGAGQQQQVVCVAVRTSRSRINVRGSAVIEVLDADGNPAEGFSGLGAARLMDQDDVAAALLFGPGSN